MDTGAADESVTRDVGAIDANAWVAIGAMSLAVFAIANDFTAMNVVLPDIESEFDTNLSTVQWVVNGYALIFGVLIVPGGRLADMYGRKEVLAVGALLFAGFSLAGGFAPNIWILILARLLMGVGGALMWPAILGLIYAILPVSRAALAGGLVIGVAGIGNAVGPVLAGALGEIDWRLIFFLNVPIALLALAVVWRFVHVDAEPADESIDYAGTALLSVSLLALLGALNIAPNEGYGSPVVIAGFVLCLAAFIGFVGRERRMGEQGLIPTSVLHVRPFVYACLATLAMSAVFFGVLFYLPQFFQKVLGEGTLTSGLMLLPFVGMLALASFSESSMVAWIGIKAVITIGAGCLFVGPLLLVVVLDSSADWASVVPGMVVLGTGVGLFYSAVTTSALGALPPERSSLAGGLLYMFQIAGGSLGLALTTTVFLAISSNEIDQAATDIGVTLTDSELTDVQGVLVGTETSQQLLAANPDQAAQLTEIVRDSFVEGMRWAFAFDAALCLIGFAIAAFFVEGPITRFGRDRTTPAEPLDET